MQKNINKNGFTLIETLIYCFFLSIIIGIIATSLIISSASYKNTNKDNKTINDGGYAMRRIISEIRNANDIDEKSSSFNNYYGILYLYGFDENKIPKVTEIYFLGGKAYIKVNGGNPELIIPGDSNVDYIMFHEINTGNSKAVKVEIKISRTSTGTVGQNYFYDTAVLRGSYVNH